MKNIVEYQQVASLTSKFSPTKKTSRATIGQCALKFSSHTIGDMHCTYCGIAGHMAKDCKLPRYNKKFVNLVGARFARLLVLEQVPRPAGTKARSPRWRCACDCGQSIETTGDLLRCGDAQSCGCLRLERIRLELAGQRFGRLTAVEPVASTRYGRMWLCRCDCGGESRVGATYLKAGRTTSCGCARLDKPGLSTQATLDSGTRNRHNRRARARGAGGTFTAAQVAALYTKQRGRCANCTASLKDGYHRDHRKALALGGANDISNIELLCSSCNCRKRAKDELAWANENGRLC